MNLLTRAWRYLVEGPEEPDAEPQRNKLVYAEWKPIVADCWTRNEFDWRQPFHRPNDSTAIGVICSKGLRPCWDIRLEGDPFRATFVFDVATVPGEWPSVLLHHEGKVIAHMNVLVDFERGDQLHLVRIDAWVPERKLLEKESA